MLLKKYYNYPITEDELIKHQELFDVTTIIVRYRTVIVGIYSVKDVRVINKSDLKLLDYPVQSSRHKADTKYILFALEKYNGSEIDLNFHNFRPLIGKGIKNDL